MPKSNGLLVCVNVVSFLNSLSVCYIHGTFLENQLNWCETMDQYLNINFIKNSGILKTRCSLVLN